MQTLPKCNIAVDVWNLLPVMISLTFAAQTRVDLGIVSKLVIHWTGSFPDSHPWVNIPTTAPWCETHFLAHFEIQMFLNQPFLLCSSCTKPTGAAVNPKMVKVSTFSCHSEKGKKPEWMFLSQNQNGCFSLLLWSGFFMKRVWNTWGFSMLLSNSSQTCHVRAQRLHRKKKYLDRLPCKGCFALEKLLSGN